MNWRSTHCPRFESCNAPICPLDPDWRRSRCLEGEAICRYLAEMSKDAGSAARLGECDGVMRGKLEDEYPDIVIQVGAVRRALQRASRRPFKLGPKQGVHTGETRNPGDGSSES